MERYSVKAGRVNGDGRRRGQSGISVIAGRRAEGEDFSASFLELQGVVGRSCKSRAKWEEKVVAGIQATLEFAATSPGKARALTIAARRPAFGESNPEQVVLAYFVNLLAEVAPAERRIPVSTDESIVQSIATLIRGHLLGGTEDQLPAAAPDVIYLALMPYLGLTETQYWAGKTAPVGG